MTISHMEYDANGIVTAITFFNVIETDDGPQVFESRLNVVLCDPSKEAAPGVRRAAQNAANLDFLRKSVGKKR